MNKFKKYVMIAVTISVIAVSSWKAFFESKTYQDLNQKERDKIELMKDSMFASFDRAKLLFSEYRNSEAMKYLDSAKKNIPDIGGKPKEFKVLEEDIELFEGVLNSFEDINKFLRYDVGLMRTFIDNLQSEKLIFYREAYDVYFGHVQNWHYHMNLAKDAVARIPKNNPLRKDAIDNWHNKYHEIELIINSWLDDFQELLSKHPDNEHLKKFVEFLKDQRKDVQAKQKLNF